MPPRRSRPLAEPLFGSGGLVVAGISPELGGSGMELLDTRPRGFSAKITDQPDADTNAYAFAKADDGDPDFAELSGDAAITGDGIVLAAYERGGRTDVPTDGSAVVWLEPLRGGVGYSFTWPAGSSVSLTSEVENAQHDISADGVWQDTSASLPTLTLTPGDYLLSLKISFELHVTALAVLGTAEVYVRLFDVEAGAAVPGSQAAAAPAQVTARQVRSCTGFSVPYTVEEETTIRIEAFRVGGHTWLTSRVGSTLGGAGDHVALTALSVG